VVGENNSSESGAIMYDCVEFEDYLGNVGINAGGSPYLRAAVRALTLTAGGSWSVRLAHLVPGT